MYLQFHPEIKEALKQKQAVVALESTIITHGMPYPENVETALLVEQTIRNQGAIPATCAIINGQLKAGLKQEEIEKLGKLGNQVPKASRRDIPYLLSKKLNGATTVAATMIIAKAAEIPIFATGGIGGVHRGAEQTMDISADLQELNKTSVAVVCGGAKAILDLALTKEYMETFGIPLVGYGTSELPAFYSRTSGLSVDYQLDTVEEIARFLKVKWDLGLEGGVVIANPVPEKYEMAYLEVNKAIEQAILKSQRQNIKGKKLSPFLLGEIKELTGGLSLKANIQLVLNNARLAAQLAKEFNRSY